MQNESWIAVDTETSGLIRPIYVVEIAAQRMRGWERVGEPFHVWLNHDVPIDPRAEAVHGYSREFLRANGSDPHKAHRQFHDYVGDLPIVAYNLSFDWDRCLVPEYARLGVAATGRKGFCAMTLARRTISETSNYKLETLKQHFHLNTAQSHRASSDVETLCGLFDLVFAPRLTKAGILGFEKISQFSRLTPVARCLQQIMACGLAIKRQEVLVHHAAMSGESASKASLKSHARWVDEIITLSRSILADGVVTESEIHQLQEWLTGCPCTQIYPINVIADKVEQIVCDGIITAEERIEMKQCLDSVLQATG